MRHGDTAATTDIIDVDIGPAELPRGDLDIPSAVPVPCAGTTVVVVAAAVIAVLAVLAANMPVQSMVPDMGDSMVLTPAATAKAGTGAALHLSIHIVTDCLPSGPP